MEIQKPFFSIVMPAYNVEEFIGEAIDSVLTQTFDNWELIIVDDQSTDRTLAIIREYRKKDSRIKLYQLDKNSGSAYQPRKRAIEEGVGEYIVSLDADDTVESDYLKKLYNRIQETHSQIIYGKMIFEKMSLPVETFDSRQTYCGIDAVKYTLDGWKIGANGAINRNYYLKVIKKYEADGKDMNADEILTRQLLIDAESLSFANASYYYRANYNSITKSVGHHRFSALDSVLNLRNLIYSNFNENSTERQLIEQQSLSILWSCLRLYFQNYSNFKGRNKELNKRFQNFYNQINWSLIKNVSPIKLRILKLNLKCLKFWTILGIIYNERLKRRK